jgi:hypothetical protein
MQYIYISFYFSQMNSFRLSPLAGSRGRSRGGDESNTGRNTTADMLSSRSDPNHVIIEEEFPKIHSVR